MTVSARLASALLAIVAVAALAASCKTLSVDGSHSAQVIDDPTFTVDAQAAEVIFAGTLLQRHRSSCAPSGVGASTQALTFAVTEVMKGDFKLTEVTVDYVLTGTGPLEVKRRGCLQVSPEILRKGRQFIVGCSFRTWLHPNGGWAVAAGPYVDSPETRAAVALVLNRSLGEESGSSGK